MLLRNKQANKYEATYNGPFTITQIWTNGKVTLSIIFETDRVNIHHLKIYYTSERVLTDYIHLLIDYYSSYNLIT